MSKKVISFFSLITAAILFGSFGIWIRFLSKDLTMYQQIVFRNCFALLFSLIIVLFRSSSVKPNLKSVNRLHLLIYSFVIPISVIFYNISMLYTKIAVATFAFYIGTIVFSTLFGILIFKETINTKKIISLLLTFLGLMAIIYPFSTTTLNWGFIAGIISGSLDAFGNVFRRNLSGKINKFLLVLITSVGGVIVSGIMIKYSGDSLTFMFNKSINIYLLGIVFGFILIAVNYLLLVGFQHFDLSLGSIVLASELFFAVLFGLAVLGEQPLINEMIGGLLILIAVIFSNIELMSKKKISIISSS